MNIQTVIANLLNTIEGKEQMLAQLTQRKDVKRDPIDQAAFIATIGFLEVNLKELEAILADCMKVREADIVADLERKQKDIEQSWRDNPDRMGGQFTDDEINDGQWYH